MVKTRKTKAELIDELGKLRSRFSELEKSEKRHRMLVETVQDMILTVDIKTGSLTSANSFVEKMLGYERNEILEDFHFIEFIHEDDREKVSKAFQDRLVDRRVIPPGLQFRARKKSGDIIHVEEKGIELYDDEGNLSAYLTVLRDITERKLAEKKFRESEARYRTLIEEANDLIITIDLKTGFMSSVNNFGLALLGYKREDVVNRLKYNDFIHPDDYGLVIERISELASDRIRKPNFPLRVKKANGDYIHAEANGAVLYDGDGNPETFIGVLRDITERMKTEEALRRSEELYRLHFENVGDIVYSADSNFCITSMSPSVEVVLGYRAEEMVGRSIADLGIIAPESIQTAIQNISRVLAGEQVGPIEYEFIAKDGARKSGEVVSNPLFKNGKVETIISVARDLTERKLTEKALRESEEKYRGLFENAIESIITLDLKGNFTTSNPATENVLGYPVHELIGANYRKFIVPESWEAVAEMFNRLFRAGEPVRNVQYEIIAKDGERRTIEGNANPMKSGDQITGFQVTARDITHAELAREALLESEQQYRTTIDSMSDAIHVVDEDIRIVLMNNAFKIWNKTLGLETNVVGKTISEVFPFLSGKVCDEYAWVLSNGKPIITEEHIEIQGREIVTDTRKVPILEGTKAKRVLTVIRDITDRKRADETLATSERRYRLLAENVIDIIWTTDLNFRFTYISPSVERIRGYTVEEAMAQSMEEVLTPASLETATTVLAKELAKPVTMQERKVRSKTLELEHYCKDGSTIWTEVKVNFLYDQEGNPTGLLGVTRDITEKKQLQQQFFQAQKMEGLGTLAGGIAHDFNNLLGGILGYASFMKSKMDEDHPFVRYVDTIERTAERAAELTSQLLGFARGGKYNVRAINLNKVVDETLELVGRTFDKSIEIETRLDESIPTIEADAGQLQQVLMNLCVNAGDAMPGGGRLTIETDVETITEEYAAAHMGMRPGLFVKLTVNDTGHGIDKETQKRIFEPFFTTKDEGKGTGLGLSMVYGVIKNHGGHINIYSEPAHGTTFRIYMPVSGKSETEKPVDVEAPSGRNELILVVDDEEHMRSLAGEVLETYNYRVLSAKDGAEAIEVFKKNNGAIGLVILDLIMPKMGGHETFLRMRAHQPSVKALLSTGYSQNGKAKEILDSGVMGFIQKPYQPNTLLAEVRRVLDTDG